MFPVILLLRDAAEILNVHFLDHLILGSQERSFVSVMEEPSPAR